MKLDPIQAEPVDADRTPSLWIRRFERHRYLILGVAFVTCMLLAARYGPRLWIAWQDEATLEALIADLGWLGPAALILFNAVQIVVAPVPGYVVQVASGYLFGPFWGGLWASFGLLAGAMLAMWLARKLGRPLAERMVSQDRLDRWATTLHSDNAAIWFVLILFPTGDLPYFLAGLSSTRFLTIFLLVLAIRVPTTFAVAAAGASAWALPWWQLAAMIGGLALLAIVFIRYQQPLVQWVDAQVQRRL